MQSAQLYFALFAVSICSAQSVVTTVAGNVSTFPATPLSAISAPLGLGLAAVDAAGNIIVSDQDNNRVFRVTPSGTLSLIAGNGFAAYSGDGGPATAAALNAPSGVTVDPQGNVYICDTGNNRIRKINPAGIISTFAGTGEYDYTGDGGPAIAATLGAPLYLASDNRGFIFVSDQSNFVVRKISLDGTISTVAGTGTSFSGGDGGPATKAGLSPEGIALDSAGNLFIADDNNVIRKVTPQGVISTVAGNGQEGFSGDGGFATLAKLNAPTGISVDSSGNIYVADTLNQRIRKITSGAISTVAGNGQTGTSGNGGPAKSALLNSPLGVAVDAAGNLYISDRSGGLRLVSTAGTISRYAGDGNLTSFSGDGGPARAATLSAPNAVAVDLSRNLYIADTANHRVRKVSPSGQITTVAGNGTVGGTGSGGLATAVSLGYPESVALSPQGDLYVLDSVDGSLFGVHKVSSNGVVTQIAPYNFFAARGLGLDGVGNVYVGSTVGLYRIAPGGVIQVNPDGAGGGLAVDSNGNVYIANFNVVKKVNSAGVVSTVAGTGSSGYSGDGGPATAAKLRLANGVAMDAAGNLYISDSGNSVIRVVSPKGIITTLAGKNYGYDSIFNPVCQFAGDGGAPASALFCNPQGLAIDSAGDLFIADSANNRIRAILAAPPTLTFAPQTIAFTGVSGGPLASPQTLTISSSIQFVPFRVSTTTQDGSNWLTAEVSSGMTPRTIQISADPSGLSAGSYVGSIVIQSDIGTPRQAVIPVSFTVGRGGAPAVALDQTNLTFTFPLGAAARSQTVRVLNTGSGKLSFDTVIASETPGLRARVKPAGLLSVTPRNGVTTPSNPVTLTVTADPKGLGPGTHNTKLLINTSAGSVSLPVTINISSNPTALLLTQRGVSFVAVAQGGTLPQQTIGVLNLGTGTLNFTTDARTITGGSWLKTAVGSDSSVAVGVDASGLSPGRYYGIVNVRSPGAANSPQVATAMLEVLPAGSNIGALISPSELVITANAGAESPGAASVLLYNPTASPKAYTASVSNADLLIAPSASVIAPNAPTTLLIQPLTSALAPGTYREAVSLQFDDGAVTTLPVTIVVARPGTSAHGRFGQEASSGGCTPTQLLPSVLSLGSGFNVPSGWPVALQVHVQDDCGTASAAGQVVAEFSNGDPAIPLVSLKNGEWDGTWQARTRASGVTVTIRARSGDGQLSGVRQVAGAFGVDEQPPVVAGADVTDAASMQSFRPLTRGGLISVVGSLLADQKVQAQTVPLPSSLGTTSVLMAGAVLPLATVSPTQISAIIPYSVGVNTQQQILVQRADTLSLPVAVNVTVADPAIFTSSGTQGMIVDAAGKLVGPANPARAGDVITVYCTGLGDLTTPVPEGTYGPNFSTVSVPVTLSIGGRDAAVQFAGLAPQLVGIYFVQAVVPAGVDASDQAPVKLTSLTTPAAVSPEVTMAIAR